MRNLKKFLALVLAFVMAMSLMVTVNAASFDDSDDITSEYAEAVEVLTGLGIINGYETDDGTIFNPEGSIRRSEVAAILYRIAANDADEEQVGIYKDYNRFTDVPSDAWYAGAVNYCANAELVVGVDEAQTRYAPHSNVTGYQVLAMVLRMLGYDANDEFRGSGWQIRTASYARQVGLTKNIKEGTLGQYATREMVAEIMFQALQVPTVSYNLLQNYYPNDVLLADNQTNRDNYKLAIENGSLTLPLHGTLMYRNYGIVGKSPELTFDAFGRPITAWAKDRADDTVTGTKTGTTPDGNAGKYIVNVNLSDSVVITADNDAKGQWAAAADATAAVKTNIGLGPNVTTLSKPMIYAAKYDNAVTECQVAKDVTGDTKVDWKNIAEVLNGNVETNFATGKPFGADATYGLKVDGTEFTNSSANHNNGVMMDALHTSDKWIGATGRTTEIYDISDYTLNDDTALTPNKQKYIFVYIDTFLGKVTNITEAIKDPNGHVIKAASATVEIGKAAAGTSALVELTLKSAGSHKVGDLVLVQTSSGGAGAGNAINGIDEVEKGEKAPAVPADVPKTDDNFTDDTSILLSNKVDTKQVTIKATVGVRDDKMGVITTDGETIYASNTFLAAKNTAAPTVLNEWYDVDVPTRGITNSMIGRTYDLILDHHGYIVGMKEVLTIDSTVGVITGIDSDRVSMGKYVSVVEAYMTDGTTRTFNVIDMTQTEFNKIAAGTAIDTKKFSFFANSNACDTIWDDSGTYGDKMGVGSLVMFKQCIVEGESVWYFADTSDLSATEFLWDKTNVAAGTFGAVGTALDKDTGAVKTGVALTLETALDLDGDPTGIAQQLDDKSVVFVAEPEYRYDTGNANEGANSVKYNVYEGFKNIPTITAAQVKTGGAAMGQGDTAAHVNILYQQLINNPEYVLVYPQNLSVEYIIRNQSTITVDDSYLVLSRGATYAQYSEYNVLKNGVADVLKVSNSNDTLNTKIEAAMAAGKLLTVTGRNGADWVISVETVEDLANATPANAVAVDNCGGVLSASTHPNPLVAGAAGTLFSVNDGVVNFNDTQGDRALTLADDCTVQLVNLGTGAYKDISLGVAKTYINNEGGKLQSECDFTFELDQYGYVCSLYVIEK